MPLSLQTGESLLLRQISSLISLREHHHHRSAPIVLLPPDPVHDVHSIFQLTHFQIRSNLSKELDGVYSNVFTTLLLLVKPLNLRHHRILYLSCSLIFSGLRLAFSVLRCSSSYSNSFTLALQSFISSALNCTAFDNALLTSWRCQGLFF